MNSPTGLIAPLVQSFFTDHLVRQRRASPQTVASYRDTFRLLIQHLSQTTGKKPSDLTLDDLQAKAIMRFLDSIERDRGNSVQTRNARLAAIRSFFRLVTLREPARLDLAAQVLAIPTKRADRRLIGYLTRPEMDAILATPSTQTWIGKRDYALLLTLYNTGARISEILTLRPIITGGVSTLVRGRSACPAQVRAWRICCLRRDEEALCLRCEPSRRACRYSSLNSGVLVIRQAVTVEIPTAAAAFSNPGCWSSARINCSRWRFRRMTIGSLIVDSLLSFFRIRSDLTCLWAAAE